MAGKSPQSTPRKPARPRCDAIVELEGSQTSSSNATIC
jgi:hypothetical protein